MEEIEIGTATVLKLICKKPQSLFIKICKVKKFTLTAQGRQKFSSAVVSQSLGN